MHQYNIVSRILLILTVITFALAAPVLVQEKRQAKPEVDVVHVPEDVNTVTVVGKRTLYEDFNVLWDGWWHYLNVLGEPAPPPIVWRNRNPAAIPPPIHKQEIASPSNMPSSSKPAEVPVPEVPPQGPSADSAPEVKGKAVVSHPISGTANGVGTADINGVDTVNAVT